MTHTHRLLAAAVLVAALAGCSGDREPTAAPSSSSPAAASTGPPQTEVDARRGCAAVGQLINANDFDPAKNRDAGVLAQSTPGLDVFGAAGELVVAANDALAEPGPAANVAIAEAQLDLYEACVKVFGEEPW